MRIAVTGATGAVGCEVARALAGESGVRLVVRDVDKAARMGLPGEVHAADYGDVPALERALAGAEALFVVTGNPLRPEHDEHILAAAKAAGVRHAVKISWTAVADPTADDLVARWNRRSEELLRDSGLSWTVLRMRTPMSNALGWAASIRDEGVVRALGGADRTACVDPRDVAAVAVEALHGAEHAGRTYALTGPEPISVREQVEELAGVLQHPIRFEELTEEQAFARWCRRFPDEVARALLQGAQRRAAGASAAVEGTVAAVTGRAPANFARWAADHADRFRAR
ncbi:NAD(P)H-binding protein [Streptomyces sp. B-S-A8]|uniref:NAD(P)H-binding protein n=1 Tax=Streptomyces solicavernae TaxID=3043614 RepID=A0ABT6S1V0_9ACTN|nr:NAD(P)H-binding protein [Streptomyces sp. B-S-A8]MDI3389978.1 NAD(P)H-binding protein [Streptomyces sp. B-S-A8]